MLLKIVSVKTCIISFSFLFICLASFAQPARLELGMKRSTAQTLMGKAKIDSYTLARTVYTYPGSVFFTIDFDENELCKGFYWSATDEPALIKTMEQNGFVRRDSVAFTANDFGGTFQKESENSQVIYRFIPSATAQQPQEKKAVPVEETIPKEKPFYGFTILGAKVWEKEE